MRLPCCPAVLLLSLAVATTAAAAESDALFDQTTLQEIRLRVNARDWQDLRDHYLEDVYVPADLQWRDQIVRNIAIRSRGLSSRSGVKPGLRLDMNRYVSGQRFLGLKALALDNLVTDPALVREMVAMTLFARMGEPVPREAFARVYVNDGYAGVYAIVEALDTNFLTRTFGRDDGYLFERRFNGEFRGEDLGDPIAYAAIFDPVTHEKATAAELYGPIAALFREAAQPVDGAWRERVEQFADLGQMIRHVAIETYLAEVDGILGYAGMSNLLLYRAAGSDRHRFLVWDKDRTFSAIDSPILPRTDGNALFGGALTFPDLRALYFDTLEQCARVSAADDWFDRTVDTASTLVDRAAREDGFKPPSNDDYAEAAAALRRFARERPAFVTAAVALARQAAGPGSARR